MRINLTLPMFGLAKKLPALAALALWDDVDAPYMHDRFAATASSMITSAFGDAAECRVSLRGTVTVTIANDAVLPESLSTLGEYGAGNFPDEWPCEFDGLDELELAVRIIVAVAWCRAFEICLSAIMGSPWVALLRDALGDGDEQNAEIVAQWRGMIPDVRPAPESIAPKPEPVRPSELEW